MFSLVSFTSLVEAPPTNLIKNPSFEQGFNKWAFVVNTPNESEAFTTVQSGGVDGNKFLNTTNISQFKSGDNFINQNISIYNSKLIESSFYYKTQGSTDFLSLHNSVCWDDINMALQLHCVYFNDTDIFLSAFDNSTRPMYLLNFTKNISDNWNFVKVRINRTDAYTNFINLDIYVQEPTEWASFDGFLITYV